MRLVNGHTPRVSPASVTPSRSTLDQLVQIILMPHKFRIPIRRAMPNDISTFQSPSYFVFPVPVIAITIARDTPLPTSSKPIPPQTLLFFPWYLCRSRCLGGRCRAARHRIRRRARIDTDEAEEPLLRAFRLGSGCG